MSHLSFWFVHIQKLQQVWKQLLQVKAFQFSDTKPWASVTGTFIMPILGSVSLIWSASIPGFHTANKTNTCKPTKSHRSMWAKTTCHFPRITEFQSSTKSSFDKIRGKGAYIHFPISCLQKLLNSIQNLPRANLFLPSCSLRSWKRHCMRVNWGQPLLERSHK